MRCTSFRAGTASLRSDVPCAKLVTRYNLQNSMNCNCMGLTNDIVNDDGGGEVAPTTEGVAKAVEIIEV